ncbi:MAG: sulfatase-like hydrolase/transferase, partial [Candidatus Latescibacteria bacterium]|nr:sulfatase-like hydrolase/transferase [Candidatus Latescibacterota bacterium]
MSNTTDRPNILFFFPDQQRFDWIGSNTDIPVRTPNLDRLQREGVNFTKTLCPSPVCAPSRACVAAGLEYDNCP